MKTLIAVTAVAFVLVAGVVEQSHGGNNWGPGGRWPASGGGSSYVNSYGLQELYCLGLPQGDYEKTYSYDGQVKASLDGQSRLKVTVKGTYSWAIFRGAHDDINGPFDINHERLYFGSTQYDVSKIIDPYEQGTYWDYSIPPVAVTGINGTFTLISATDFGFITFRVTAVKHGDGPQISIATMGSGSPICPPSNQLMGFGGQ